MGTSATVAGGWHARLPEFGVSGRFSSAVAFRLILTLTSIPGLTARTIEHNHVQAEGSQIAGKRGKDTRRVARRVHPIISPLTHIDQNVCACYGSP